MHYFFIGMVIFFVIGLIVVGAVMDGDDMKQDD